MPGRLVVGRRVLVLGIVTTANLTAGQTEPQIDPCVAFLYALKTRIGRAGHDLTEVRYMIAVPLLPEQIQELHTSLSNEKVVFRS